MIRLPVAGPARAILAAAAVALLALGATGPGLAGGDGARERAAWQHQRAGDRLWREERRQERARGDAPRTYERNLRVREAAEDVRQSRDAEEHRWREDRRERRERWDALRRRDRTTRTRDAIGRDLRDHEFEERKRRIEEIVPED